MGVGRHVYLENDWVVKQETWKLLVNYDDRHCAQPPKN